jgi:hypothetical protein
VPAIGVNTGAPSKISRLAGRSLTKMRGGSLCTATAGGVSVSRRRLRRRVSSGTRLAGSAASADRMCSSIRSAWAVSAAGKRELTSWGFDSVTQRVDEVGAEVAKLTSTVPSTAAVAPAGVTLSAMRVRSVCRSGQAMTCG